MKKILCVCVFLLATVAVFAVDIGTALDQAAEQFSSTLQTGTTIAIVGIASDTEDMSEYMLDELTLRFVQQRRLTVANRANLDAIKKEMNFQLSGEVSDASIQEIGAMAGAEIVIHGSLEQVGDMFFLMVQALNVTTATVEDMYRETVLLDKTSSVLLGKGVNSKGNVIDLKDDYSIGQRLGLGFLNHIALGTGSYISGHIWDGVIVTTGVLLGGAGFISTILLNPEGNFSPLYPLSGALIGFSIIYGYVRPFFYHKSDKSIVSFTDRDGLHLGFVPFGDTPIMQVSYRKSF